jgi:hypothetical protein
MGVRQENSGTEPALIFNGEGNKQQRKETDFFVFKGIISSGRYSIK